MIEIRRILCPTDFSDCSRGALDHAIGIARWYGSVVTALHVFSRPLPSAGYGAATALDHEQLLAEVKAFIAAEGAPGIIIGLVVREGNTATEILDEATAMDADLLVIGTHGRSGFERLLLGSVAEKVLHKASCPILTVAPRLADAAPSAPVLYKRILCPLDFSDPSSHALEYAMSLAQKTDGRLSVLHVVSHEFENTGDIASNVQGGMTVGEFLREREETLYRRLQSAESVATAVCSVESILTYGKPWREILRVAEERQSDVIVMGIHGRDAADQRFFGSTAQHVVREASRPVLSVPRR